MRIFRYSLLALLFLLVSPAVFGQGLRNFTDDPVKFADELQKFLAETDKKEAEKVM